jgi:hypothetical protein
MAPEWDRIYLGLGRRSDNARVLATALPTGLTVTTITDVDAGTTSTLSWSATNHNGGMTILDIAGGCMRLPAGFSPAAVLRHYPFGNFAIDFPAGWIASPWLTHTGETALAASASNPWRYVRTAPKSTAPVCVGITEICQNYLPRVASSASIVSGDWGQQSAAGVGPTEVLIWFDQPVSMVGSGAFYTTAATVPVVSGGSTTNPWAQYSTEASKHPLLPNCIRAQVTSYTDHLAYVVPTATLIAGRVQNAAGLTNGAATVQIEAQRAVWLHRNGYDANDPWLYAPDDNNPPDFSIIPRRIPGNQTGDDYPVAATAPADTEAMIWEGLTSIDHTVSGFGLYSNPRPYKLPTDDATWTLTPVDLRSGYNREISGDREGTDLLTAPSVQTGVATTSRKSASIYWFTVSDPAASVQYISSDPSFTTYYERGIFAVYAKELATGFYSLKYPDQMEDVFSSADPFTLVGTVHEDGIWHPASRRRLSALRYAASNTNSSSGRYDPAYTDACTAAASGQSVPVSDPELNVIWAAASAPALASPVSYDLGGTWTDSNTKFQWSATPDAGATYKTLADFGISAGDDIAIASAFGMHSTVCTAAGIWKLRYEGRTAFRRKVGEGNHGFNQSLDYLYATPSYILTVGTGDAKVRNGGTFYLSNTTITCTVAGTNPYSIATPSIVVSVYSMELDNQSSGGYSQACISGTNPLPAISQTVPATATLIGTRTYALVLDSVTWTFEGTWDINNTYFLDDILQSDGHLYKVVTASVTSNTPPDSDPTNWTCIDSIGYPSQTVIVWKVAAADLLLSIATDAPAAQIDRIYFPMYEIVEQAVFVDYTDLQYWDISGGIWCDERTQPLPWPIGSLDDGATHYPGRVPPDEATRIGL